MVTKGLPAVVLAVALGLGFAAREATASVSIPVTNYNFSDPLVTQNSGYYNQGTPNNWSTQGFSAQYFENAANGGFASGTPGNLSNIQPGLSGPNYQYVADDGHGTIYQDLGVAFKPDTTYTVDISGGNRAGFGGNYTTFGLVAGTGSIPTDGSAPTPLGGTAGFINEGALPVGSFNWASVIGSPNAAVYTFTTGNIVPLGDVVVYVNNASGGRMELGGVTVSTTPEPASLAIWGAAIAAGLIVARRRKA